MRLLLFAQNGIFGTRTAANAAAMASLLADVRIDSVGVEFPADMSRAFVGFDVGEIFIAEVTQRPENSIRRCLSQSA